MTSDDDLKPKLLATPDGSQTKMDAIQRGYEEDRRKEAEWAKLYGPFRSVFWLLTSAHACPCLYDFPAAPPGLSRRCSDHLVRFSVKFQHADDWMRLSCRGDGERLLFHRDAMDLWLEHGGRAMITEARTKAVMGGKPKPPEGGKPKKLKLKVVPPTDEPPPTAS